MYDFATDETRTYAPAETSEPATNDFPQLTIADTGWTDEERNAMRQHGYDSMDMLREWKNLPLASLIQNARTPRRSSAMTNPIAIMSINSYFAPPA